MFSEYPFDDFREFTAIKPMKSVIMEAGVPRDEKVVRDKDLKDAIVQVYSTSEGLPSKKVYAGLWNNPNLKVKLNEKRGLLQIFYESKCMAGCYCKVYSRGKKG